MHAQRNAFFKSIFVNLEVVHVERSTLNFMHNSMITDMQQCCKVTWLSAAENTEWRQLIRAYMFATVHAAQK